MSLHKTLKSKSALVRHRNVLSRAERIAILQDLGRWEEGRDPFGLPKVANRKIVTGGGKKDKKEEAAAAPAAAAEKKA